MSAIILSADNVSVQLGGRPVVQNATLALARDELAILVGPNGAGKTTLMRALAGLLPAAGAISLSGRPLGDFSPRERSKAIAYLPQGNVFHWPMPVESVVALGRYPHADPFSPPVEADRIAVRHALAATETKSFASRPVTTLSGGERARVALARALATQAPLLLADEPIVSLDARHQLAVMELLRAAARKGGAVLAVLHDLSLAARFADRVLVMQDGRIVAQDIAAKALSAERIAAVFDVEAVMVDVGGAQVPVPRRAL